MKSTLLQRTHAIAEEDSERTQRETQIIEMKYGEKTYEIECCSV